MSWSIELLLTAWALSISCTELGRVQPKQSPPQQLSFKNFLKFWVLNFATLLISFQNHLNLSTNYFCFHRIPFVWKIILTFAEKSILEHINSSAGSYSWRMMTEDQLSINGWKLKETYIIKKAIEQSWQYCFMTCTRQTVNQKLTSLVIQLTELQNVI